MAILIWGKNPAGRPVGAREQWDLSAQGELAEAWVAAGYCTIEIPKVKVQAVEKPPKTRAITRGKGKKG